MDMVVGNSFEDSLTLERVRKKQQQFIRKTMKNQFCELKFEKRKERKKVS
jgi:hypothetical protein